MDAHASILITGGGGMLADALKRALAARRRAFVAPPRGELDITNDEQVRRAFRESRPTLVLNTAAHTKVDLCEEEPAKADEINGHAVGRLAAAAKEYGAKLLHVSTDFVFDGTSRRPYREDDPTNPLSAYGRSKLLGEQKLREVDPPGWLIVRTAWVYGPNGACFPRTMVNAAKAGKPLKVVDDQVGSPTYTRELADAILALVDTGAAGVLNVANAGQVSWYGFTAAILEEFALKAELSATTSAEWKKLRPNSAVRPAYSVLDTSKYTAATGRRMRPWHEALRDYRIAVEENGGL